MKLSSIAVGTSEGKIHTFAGNGALAMRHNSQQYSSNSIIVIYMRASAGYFVVLR